MLQALEAELKSHEPVMEAVFSTGQDLNNSGHFASDRIREMRIKLQEVWSHLQRVSIERSNILQDSLEAQQYYAKALEAESWMNDREPLVSHGEYGKDEDATQVGCIVVFFPAAKF